VKIHKSILLVEDDEAHADMIMRTLAELSLDPLVHHVADGEAALDYLRHEGQYAHLDNRPRPHLILLDLRLPKIDGLQVLQAIKESSDLMAIPTVILTTSSARRDIDQAYQNRANSYLVKPMNFESLVCLIRDLGIYWLVENQQTW
jgi:CheY-like chemotaxis protein